MAVVMRARRRHRHHERWREGFRRERGRNERCSGRHRGRRGCPEERIGGRAPSVFEGAKGRCSVLVP